MSAASEASSAVRLGEVTVRFVHGGAAGPYSLIEWVAPAGAPSPPVHVHHATDEGFYVIAGTFGFLLDGERIELAVGAHLLVPKGRQHTFWNTSQQTSRCLIVLSPAGFEGYFRELAVGFETVQSEEEATQLRRQLGARWDIEVVGPPVAVGAPRPPQETASPFGAPLPTGP